MYEWCRSGLLWYHMPMYESAVDLSARRSSQEQSHHFRWACRPGRVVLWGLRQSSPLQKQIKNKGIKTGIFSMEGTPWVPNFIRKQSPGLLLIRTTRKPKGTTHLCLWTKNQGNKDRYPAKTISRALILERQRTSKKDSQVCISCPSLHQAIFDICLWRKTEGASVHYIYEDGLDCLLGPFDPKTTNVAWATCSSCFEKYKNNI
jgi:hypothetical protein